MSGRGLATVTLLVADYDEAIAWYTGKLGFTLESDTPLGDGKRWVTLATGAARLLLARADGEDQRARIGDQTGGRVAFFLETDDFWRDHAAMTAKGVMFMETPRTEPYATVAIFADLYGNFWDLLQPR